MDKQQALYKFWTEATGLKAYEENMIPDNAKLPYVTYQTLIGGLDEPVFPIGHIWSDKKLSFTSLDGYLARFDAYIGRGKIIHMDEGNLFITKGTTPAQREADDTGAIGYLISLGVEYLSN